MKLALVIALLSWTLPCFAQEAVRYALVIGHNQSERASNQTLRYADDDAVSTHALLREARVESTLLTSPDAETRELYPQLGWQAPTLAALAQAVTHIEASVRRAHARGQESEFILFYSGHGDTDDGEGYVTLADGRLTRAQLYALLHQVGATRNHVLIDACRSYYLVFDRGPGGTRERYAGAGPGSFVPAELPNTGFVLSTASDRESHEWERFRSGIFSHEVRSGLRGGADVDLDGRITYAELGAFVETANKRVLARFRPEIYVRPPHDSFAGTVLAWPSAGELALMPANWGHVYLEGARGERIMDVHPPANARLVIRVAPDRPLFVRKADQSLEYVVDSAAPTELTPEAGRTPGVAARGALNLAFEGLFASAVTAADVLSFAQRAPREPPVDAAPGRPYRRLAWTSGGIALVSLTAAFATWLRARHLESELSDLCPDKYCPANSNWRDLKSSALHQARWSYALAAVGGAATAAALVARFGPRPHRRILLTGILDCTMQSCAVGSVLRW